MSLREVASAGDRLSTLESLRDVLASALDAAIEAKDVASLSNRLQSVLAEIDELKPPEKVGDSVDEIAERRASRRTRSA